MPLYATTIIFDTVVWCDTEQEAKERAATDMLKAGAMWFHEVSTVNTLDDLPYSWSGSMKPLNAPDGKVIHDLLGTSAFDEWWNLNHRSLALDESAKESMRIVFNHFHKLTHHADHSQN